MSLSYLEYKALGGNYSNDVFEAQVGKAEAHVLWLIGWKDVPAEHEQAVKKATTLSIDALVEYGEGTDGFSIGSFRMDKGANAKTAKEHATDAAWEVLAPTGLLWAGVF